MKDINKRIAALPEQRRAVLARLSEADELTVSAVILRLLLVLRLCKRHRR